MAVINQAVLSTNYKMRTTLLKALHPRQAKLTYNIEIFGLKYAKQKILYY